MFVFLESRVINPETGAYGDACLEPDREHGFDEKLQLTDI